MDDHILSTMKTGPLASEGTESGADATAQDGSGAIFIVEGSASAETDTSTLLKSDKAKLRTIFSLDDFRYHGFKSHPCKSRTADKRRLLRFRASTPDR